MIFTNASIFYSVWTACWNLNSAPVYTHTHVRCVSIDCFQNEQSDLYTHYDWRLWGSNTSPPSFLTSSVAVWNDCKHISFSLLLKTRSWSPRFLMSPSSWWHLRFLLKAFFLIFFSVRLFFPRWWQLVCYPWRLRGVRHQNRPLAHGGVHVHSAGTGGRGSNWEQTIRCWRVGDNNRSVWP